MGIVGSLESRPGLSIFELAEELDGKRIGRCLLRDSYIDALALIDWAKEYGADAIYLVFPSSPGRLDGPGVELIGSFNPMSPGELDPGSIVRDLWMNLTGSMRREDVVSALRILSPVPFLVYECRPKGDDCRGPLGDWLKGACLD